MGYRRAGSNLVRSGSFSIFFLYRQHIICALTPHVLTSLHIVLGTQGQVHALDTSGAYLGKPCFFMLNGLTSSVFLLIINGNHVAL